MHARHDVALDQLRVLRVFQPGDPPIGSRREVKSCARQLAGGRESSASVIAVVASALELSQRRFGGVWRAAVLAPGPAEVDRLSSLARALSGGCGERADGVEGAEVVAVPGPAGGEVQRPAACVMVRRPASPESRARSWTWDVTGRAIEVQLRGRRVSLDRRYLDVPALLAYGYAVTGHVAQGMTTDRAFVLSTGTLFREWGYVAMSRGRHENRFYAVVGEPTDRDEIAPRERRRPALREIEEALARSRAQRLASESSPEVGGAHQAEDLELRRRRSWFARAAASLDLPDRVAQTWARPEQPANAERSRRRIDGPLRGRGLD